MALYRSISVGLLGACLYFVMQLPMSAPEPTPPATITHATLEPAPVTIVDVARGVEPTSVPSLVRLADGERIAAVDDRFVANDLVAGAAILERSRTGGFIDLTLESSTTTRRVLVLLH